MKYYDVEAFSGGRAIMLQGVYSSNDAYFLNTIYHNICPIFEEWSDVIPYPISTTFKDILQQFYNYYKGDKVAWLNHTMNIVYVYNDSSANSWLWYSLEMARGKKMNGKRVLIKHRMEIEKREESLEAIFKWLSEIYGHKWTYYNKLWKDKKNWYPNLVPGAS